MIVHVFNSGSVSGPERLVLPAMADVRGTSAIVNLLENRMPRLREWDPLREYARELNLDYYTVPVRRRWDGEAIRELRLLLHRLDPELAHAHDAKASVYLLQAAAERRRGRMRIVSTHHGVRGRPDWKTKLYEWFYRRRVLPRFDRVLSVSTEDYRFLLSSGIDGNRLRLHLNGVDGRRVDPEERLSEGPRIRASWFPEEPGMERLFLFGSIGRFSAEKDHARLLEVLSYLNRLPCEREWKCLMFGQGPLGTKLRDRAYRLRLDERIVWMGHRKEIADELAGLDLLVSFSKAEGLPISLIEAGWAGTPVMSTRVGGASDLIAGSSYGNLIPPAESIRESALRMRDILSEKNKAELREQGRRFQQRVTRIFTREKWLRRLEGIYAELGVRFTARFSNCSAEIPSL